MSFLTKLNHRISEVKRAYEKIRNPWWRAKFRYAEIFEKSAIDDRLILLESQHGKELNGNIFHIAKYLSQNPAYAGFRVVVSAHGKKRGTFRKKLNDHGCDSVALTTLASEDYFRILSSAKWVINDNTFLPFYMKKEGQIYLNTWHGTPLKTLGRTIRNDAYAIGNAQRNFLLADYLLFPNEYTLHHICKDYMVENLATGKALFAGYPRNEIFFDVTSRDTLRTALGLDGKRVYAYMPTFRGTARAGRLPKNDIYLNYFLYEIDRRLSEDECFYVNLHPVAQSQMDFKAFRHIRPFPPNYETYAFLNVADVLVTDYSSVFFDFACTRKKIVLFVYDEEDYLRDRGLYLPLENLPFPKARTIDALFHELRSERNYDDTAFLAQFCPYDTPNATQKLCDFLILGNETGLNAQPLPNNGKENVFLYGGNLAPNGITKALNNLLRTVDTDKRNYVVLCEERKIAKYRDALLDLPPYVGFYIHTGDINLSLHKRILRKLFKWGWLKAKTYLRLCAQDFKRELWRLYGSARINALVHFNGYESENIILFSVFPKKRIIFVHSDMNREISARGNQRKDVLSLAYQTYDTVVPVTQDLIPSVQPFAQGGMSNIRVVKNAIDYHSILTMGAIPIAFDPFTKTSIPREAVLERLQTASYRYVNIGRFSPEKGHFRLVDAFTKIHALDPNALLIIIGGSSFEGGYGRLLQHVKSLGLMENVVLIERMSNPYALLAACDGFVLSSFYEGFGLVLAEADILGIPVVSTDIVGPRSFMHEHGGTLIENSEAGLFHGMQLLRSGKIKPMGVDYAVYNASVKDTFESLFQTP